MDVPVVIEVHRLPWTHKGERLGSALGWGLQLQSRLPGLKWLETSGGGARHQGHSTVTPLPMVSPALPCLSRHPAEAGTLEL